MVFAMRSFIRKSTYWIFGGVFTAILIPVLGNWFIEVAKDKHLYDNAGETWDRVMGAVLEFATSPQVLYPLTFLGGIVAGFVIDSMAKKYDERRQIYFLKENAFGEISIAPVLSSKNGQIFEISTGFTAKQTCSGLQAYLSLQIVDTRRRAGEWQTITLGASPVVTAGDIRNYKLMSRDEDDYQGSMIIDVTRDVPPQRKVPSGQIVRAIVNFEFRIGLRRIVLQEPFLLAAHNFIPGSPWPDLIRSIDLSQDNEFREKLKTDVASTNRR